MASLSTSYWFNAGDTLPNYTTTPYTPTGLYPTLTKKGITIYSNPTGGVPQVGCQTNYYTMGPSGTSGSTSSSSSSSQSLVSFGPVSSPIYQYDPTTMIAIFSQPLSSFPTLTLPHTTDVYYNMTLPSPYACQFVWDPRTAGTGQVFQFSNVSGYTGTISAPPVTVLAPLSPNSVVSIGPTNPSQVIVQGSEVSITVYFQYPLASNPTVIARVPFTLSKQMSLFGPES